MASTHTLTEFSVPTPRTWTKLLLPSYADCLFVAVLIWLFTSGGGAWIGLLEDGDAGWHIRTGDWILQNGSVPKYDLFSFSRAGDPWYAWEWLTDVIFALLHGWAGLKGILLFTAFLIATFSTLLFRHMVAKGASGFIALVLALVVTGASAIHYLTRPHILTLVGLTIALALLDADQRRPSKRIWLLVPLTALWTNLHGGFLALIACLGLLTAGAAIEALVPFSAGSWSRVRRYGLLLAACSGATIVNPYGYQLHLHIYDYLRSDFIRNHVHEFQSPSFRGESMLQFEALLFLGLITVGYLVYRRQWGPALCVLFWAHSALGSARHIPLYLIVAAPWIAMMLNEGWVRWMDSAPAASIRGICASLAHDMQPGLRRSSVWTVVAILCLVAADSSLIAWPKDFPAYKFPAGMAGEYRQKLLSGRLLTMDQWADYLIYHNYPHQRVFVDGRSDFFGKDLGTEYLGMTQGRWDWRQLLAKHQFDVVLAPQDWPLASLLKTDCDWQLVADDGQALLFTRVGAQGQATPVPGACRGLEHPGKAGPLPNENTRSGRS